MRVGDSGAQCGAGRAAALTVGLLPAGPFRIRGETMSTSPPWSIGDHLWRKLGPRNHHLGTITKIWHDGTRWMVEYEHGVRTRETVTAPADEMYKAGPINRPI